MAFGLSNTGFLIKRLTQILSDMDAKARTEFGEGVNTGNTGALGKYLGITAAELAELWELAESIWGAMSPSTAEGILLDSLLELNNIVKLPADETEFWARYDGVNGTIIPADSVSRHPDTEDLYDLITATTIAATAALRTEATISAIAAVADTWTTTVDAFAYAFTQLGGGTVQDIVDGLRTDINTTNDYAIATATAVSRTFVINAGDGDVTTSFVAGKSCVVTTGANAGTFTVVSRAFDGTNTSVVVTEDVVTTGAVGTIRKGITATTFTDDATIAADTLRIDVALPDAATNADLFDVSVVLAAAPVGPPAGAWAFSSVGTAGLTRARETGPKIVAQGVVFELVTGTGGLTGAVAALAGDTGRDVETDSEVRVRRLNSLQQGGTTVDAIRAALLVVDGVDAARVYENDTFAVDAFGRPAKSVHAVVRGGDAQAIGDEIWAQKAAGIQAWGTDQTVTVVDLQGISHLVEFDRVDNVGTLVTVDVGATYSEETVPTGVEALIQDAVETAGNLLNIGEDVIAQRFYGPIFAAVSGIEEMRVAVRRSTVTGDAVIAAAAGAGGTFTVVGDVTLTHTVGTIIGIEAADNNDGLYTIATAVFGGVNTVITIIVTETVPSAAGALGNLFVMTEAEGIDADEEATFDADDVSVVGV